MSFKEDDRETFQALLSGTELEGQRSVVLPCGVTISASYGHFLETGNPIKFSVELDEEVDGIPRAGITSRSLEEAEQEIPDLFATLYEFDNLNHIIITGNGFSLMPIELLDKLRDGRDVMPLVVVSDLFSYEELLSDLEPYSSITQIAELIEKLNILIEAAKAGKIELVAHKVGEDNANELMSNADAVINVCGPTENTLQAQLDMLQQNGRLISYFGTYDKEGNLITN